jgi:hypothetical protein
MYSLNYWHPVVSKIKNGEETPRSDFLRNKV